MQKGVYVENLKEEIVVSPDQVMSLLAAGESHRHIGTVPCSLTPELCNPSSDLAVSLIPPLSHVGATNYNALSSRSHTIFRVLIESRERQDEILSLTPGGFTSSAVRVSYLVCLPAVIPGLQLSD